MREPLVLALAGQPVRESVISILTVPTKSRHGARQARVPAGTPWRAPTVPPPCREIAVAACGGRCAGAGLLRYRQPVEDPVEDLLVFAVGVAWVLAVVVVDVVLVPDRSAGEFGDGFGEVVVFASGRE